MPLEFNSAWVVTELVKLPLSTLTLSSKDFAATNISDAILVASEELKNSAFLS
jgi:hypothetical protein